MAILNSDQTWQLWQQGKDAWNKEIQSGHITEVTFSGRLDSYKCQFKDCYFPDKTYFKNVSFRAATPEPGVSFENAHFKEVDFTEINFNSGAISFENSVFNGRTIFENTALLHANFRRAIFKDITDFKNSKIEGISNFDSAEFNGRAIFEDTSLLKANFRRVKFKDIADFKNSKIEGNANFYSAEFSSQSIFSNTTLEKANFENTKFKEKSDFTNAIFRGRAVFDNIESKNDMHFTGAKFEGPAHFNGASFSKDTGFMFARFSDISAFINAKFGERNIFMNTKFGDNANFDLIEASQSHMFSFKGASFDSIFSISSEEKIGCVIDFVDTQAKYNLYLGDISCVFHRERKDLTNHRWLSCIFKYLLCGFQVAKDIHDISRLRKLKKIAQEEKDHLRALDYRVQEMQAKRWHDSPTEKTLFLSKLLKATPEFIFWLFSNYGRSIARPIIWLLLLTFGMAIAYYCLAPTHTSIDCSKKQGSCLSEQVDCWDALGYSASQIFPWVPIARKDELLEAQNNGSTTVISPYIKVLSFIQTLFGTLFLFLLGLGARNRFLL